MNIDTLVENLLNDNLDEIISDCENHIDELSDDVRFPLLYALCLEETGKGVMLIQKLYGSFFNRKDIKFVRSGLFNPEHIWKKEGLYSDRGLMESCKFGNLPLFQDIIKKAPIPERLQKDSLIHACESGNLDLVKFVMKIFNIEDVNYVIENSTPLMSAIRYGRKNIAEFLLENGANIHLKNDENQNVLHIACDEEEKTEIVEMILEKTKRIDILESYITINSVSVDFKSGNYNIEELIEELNEVQKVVDFDLVNNRVTVRSDDIYTMIEFTSENLIVGKFLGITMNEGIVHTGRMFTSDFTPGILQNEENKFGCIPLHNAVICGHYNTVKYLKDISDIKKKDYSGTSSLNYSYIMNDREMKELLETSENIKDICDLKFEEKEEFFKEEKVIEEKPRKIISIKKPELMKPIERLRPKRG